VGEFPQLNDSHKAKFGNNLNARFQVFTDLGTNMQAIQRFHRSAVQGAHVARRRMSGHGTPEEMKKETLDWKKYSAGKFPHL